MWKDVHELAVSMSNDAKRAGDTYGRCFVKEYVPLHDHRDGFWRDIATVTIGRDGRIVYI